MTDEWDAKRVADLVVGDEVRDYGELMAAKIYFPARRLLFPESTEHWPMEARVDVRRPVTDAASRLKQAMHDIGMALALIEDERRKALEQ